MSDLIVTPLYVAATVVLMVVLSTRVGLLRGQHGVGLGHGGVGELELAIRRFGNLSEYAAVALLLLLLLELKGVSATWLHAYGLTFVLLRLLHPFALFADMDAPMWMKVGRFISAGGTAFLLLVGSVALVMT